MSHLWGHPGVCLRQALRGFLTFLGSRRRLQRLKGAAQGSCLNRSVHSIAYASSVGKWGRIKVKVWHANQPPMCGFSWFRKHTALSSTSLFSTCRGCYPWSNLSEEGTEDWQALGVTESCSCWLTPPYLSPISLTSSTPVQQDGTRLHCGWAFGLCMCQKGEYMWRQDVKNVT